MASCNRDVDLTSVVNKQEALDSIIASAGNAPVYIFFKNEKCGACQIMKKPFLAYRELCNKERSNAILIMVDYDTARELFETNDITVYPQVWVYLKNKLIKKIVGADTSNLTCAFKYAGLQFIEPPEKKEKKKKGSSEKKE